MPPKGSKKVKIPESKKKDEDAFSDISDEEEIEIEDQIFPEDGDLDVAEEPENKDTDEDDAEGADGDDLDIVEDIDDEPVLQKNIKIYKFVAPDNRETSSRLTKYEFGRVLGERARHIDNGATIYVDIESDTTSIAIAYRELVSGVLPMAILRHVGNGMVEYWKLKEMTIPQDIPGIETFQR